MRLFLAIDLDDATRRAAAAWMRDLSTRLGARLDRDIKWVEPHNLHLTVHFFGHVEAVRGEEIAATLAATTLPSRAFDLTIGGAGTFPPHGPPRVLWLGVTDASDESGPLAALYRDVQASLATIGSAADPDARPFNPHLTLGRVRTPSGALGRALREILRSAPATFGRTTVRHLTLYESRLSPKGPTYTAIALVPLIG